MAPNWTSLFPFDTTYTHCHFQPTPFATVLYFVRTRTREIFFIENECNIFIFEFSSRYVLLLLLILYHLLSEYSLKLYIRSSDLDQWEKDTFVDEFYVATATFDIRKIWLLFFSAQSLEYEIMCTFTAHIQFHKCCQHLRWYSLSNDICILFHWTLVRCVYME